MRIRLISDSYEPGSTFKILTAAAALDSGVTTPEDGFYCSAKITVDGDTIRCGRERVRVANIDAPELPGSPKCQDRRVSYA